MALTWVDLAVSTLQASFSAPKSVNLITSFNALLGVLDHTSCNTLLPDWGPEPEAQGISGLSEIIKETRELFSGFQSLREKYEERISLEQKHAREIKLLEEKIAKMEREYQKKGTRFYRFLDRQFKETKAEWTAEIHKFYTSRYIELDTIRSSLLLIKSISPMNFMQLYKLKTFLAELENLTKRGQSGLNEIKGISPQISCSYIS